VFFPAVDVAEETGVKRGCVVLCQEKTGTEIEESIYTLTRHTTH